MTIWALRLGPRWGIQEAYQALVDDAAGPGAEQFHLFVWKNCFPL